MSIIYKFISKVECKGGINLKKEYYPQKHKKRNYRKTNKSIFDILWMFAEISIILSMIISIIAGLNPIKAILSDIILVTIAFTVSLVIKGILKLKSVQHILDPESYNSKTSFKRIVALFYILLIREVSTPTRILFSMAFVITPKSITYDICGNFDYNYFNKVY